MSCYLYEQALENKLDNSTFQVLLSSSPKYTGMRDEAPRFMGEGFVVAASNEIDVYYYMDEAGIIPPSDQVLFTIKLPILFCYIKNPYLQV